MLANDRIEAFTGLVLRYRGRTGLTQRGIARRLGVHTRSIQAWESGTSYPDTEHLQSLIIGYLETGGFGAGREAAEAKELWNATVRESPRPRPPFDSAWFADLLAERAGSASPGVATPQNSTSGVTVPEPGGSLPRSEDWGDAPDVLGFLGRARELATLERWLLQERCRVVGLLGMGGIGKTMLAAQLARNIASAFERVYWRSAYNAPSLSDWLGGAIALVSDQQCVASVDETARLELLLELLRGRRCLLVLDNFDVLLQAGGHAGTYREGCAGYGRLVDVLGQSPHQSCLVLTSREAPLELSQLDGEHAKVHALELSGLDAWAGQALLAHKGLRGDPAAWLRLVESYGGNALALKVVGESIHQVFGGDIGEFLQQAGTSAVFGGIRRLLDGQFSRLSALEHDVLTWLAVQRQPVAFAELVRDVGRATEPGAVLEAVEALRRRSLIEPGEPAGTFTLQSKMLGYVREHTQPRRREPQLSHVVMPTTQPLRESNCQATRTFEPGRFDYKAVLNTTTPNDRDGHAASIRRTACAMANTDGGFILFGIKDRKEPVRGPEERIVGIPPGDLRKQVGDKLLPLQPEVYFEASPASIPVPGDSGRVVFVVWFPASPRRPHQDSTTHVFWRRGAGGAAVAMDVYEVRDQMQLTEERLRRAILLHLEIGHYRRQVARLLELGRAVVIDLTRFDTTAIKPLLADVVLLLPPNDPVISTLLDVADEANRLNVLLQAVGSSPTAPSEITLNMQTEKIAGHLRELDRLCSQCEPRLGQLVART